MRARLSAVAARQLAQATTPRGLPTARRCRGGGPMAIAPVLLVIVVASVIFNLLSPWWFTPVASNWGHIDDTFDITMAITGLVFVIINLFLAYTLWRFRHRQQPPRNTYQPESKKLEWWLIGATTVGIVAMLTPGLFVYSDFVRVPANAVTVEVMGSQWQWRYRLPGSDGVLGTTAARFTTATNPYGINPGDPNGQDDILIQGDQLHLERDQPVKLLLRSKDVLHDFNVPEFRVKMDMVPGQITYFWFTPTRLGTFDVMCAEFCGIGHFNMRSQVVVDRPEDYRQWLAGHPTYQASLSADPVPAADPVARGEQLARNFGCLGCHSLDGSPAVGPTWKDLYGRMETLDDGSRVLVDDAYLRTAILEPNLEIVAGYQPIMPAVPFADADLAALILFIRSLSDKKPVDSGERRE